MKKVTEEFPGDPDDKEGDEATGTENKGVLHRDMAKNEIETNWDTLKKLIEKCPDDLDD